MDDAIYEILTGVSSINNKVNGRVTPIIREQNGALPALTYRKVSSPRMYDLDGIATTSQDFDVFIYAKSHAEVQNLVTAIEEDVAGLSGTYGGLTVEFIRIELIGNDDFLEDEEVFTDSVEIRIRFK